MMAKHSDSVALATCALRQKVQDPRFLKNPGSCLLVCCGSFIKAPQGK